MINRDALIEAINRAGSDLLDEHWDYGYGGEAVRDMRIDAEAVADFLIEYLNKHQFTIEETP